MPETQAPSMPQLLRIGLIVNPLAGLGGSLGLKGSDDLPAAVLCANSSNPEALSRSMQRAVRGLSLLCANSTKLTFVCPEGAMGEQVLNTLGFACEVVESNAATRTSAADTRHAAKSLVARGVDIIVFVGGDGTARDVYDALGDSFPVLGIPAGVKMHSGVFAVSPEAAGELLLDLVKGGLVALALREVRDIDEQAFRQDIVRSRFYGELLVPESARYLQHTKIGGVENAELAADDIAAWVVECMEDERTYIVGPGSTTAAIMTQLNLDNTLLGVDVIRARELLYSDANEKELLALLDKNSGPVSIIVTAIGGQGYVFGRGNQQISAAVIRAVGLENIIIVAAKSKIASLQGRPLRVDTNDPGLDKALSGYRSITTAYNEKILYRLTYGV